MDLRKLQKLIELVEGSGIAELEITEGEEKVRITRSVAAPTVQTVYAPAPVAAPQIAPAVAAPVAAPATPSAPAALDDRGQRAKIAYGWHILSRSQPNGCTVCGSWRNGKRRSNHLHH